MPCQLVILAEAILQLIGGKSFGFGIVGGDGVALFFARRLNLAVQLVFLRGPLAILDALELARQLCLLGLNVREIICANKAWETCKRQETASPCDVGHIHGDRRSQNDRNILTPAFDLPRRGVFAGRNNRTQNGNGFLCSAHGQPQWHSATKATYAHDNAIVIPSLLRRTFAAFECCGLFPITLNALRAPS